MKTLLEIIDEIIKEKESFYWNHEYSDWLREIKKIIENNYWWISVKDRLPTPKRRYSDEVICYIQENKGIVMAYYDSTDGDWGGESLLFLWDVTHWMELPLPPKQ